MIEVNITEAVTRLVLGVARLGEADLFGWWGCHGLDRAGSFVLKRSFPKTWRSAGLELDLLSASRRHDDALSGRKSALHLFSDELPFRRWAAAWLAEQKTAREVSPLFDEVASWDLETARAQLIEWAGPSVPGEVVGSGLRLGRISRAELESEDSVEPLARQLAAAYAGQDAELRVPYLDLGA